jgi:hypothetical protein
MNKLREVANDGRVAHAKHSGDGFHRHPFAV